jgi:hypothetical protein
MEDERDRIDRQPKHRRRPDRQPKQQQEADRGQQERRDRWRFDPRLEEDARQPSADEHQAGRQPDDPRDVLAIRLGPLDESDSRSLEWPPSSPGQDEKPDDDEPSQQ